MHGHMNIKNVLRTAAVSQVGDIQMIFWLIILDYKMKHLHTKYVIKLDFPN